MSRLCRSGRLEMGNAPLSPIRQNYCRPSTARGPSCSAGGIADDNFPCGRGNSTMSYGAESSRIASDLGAERLPHSGSAAESALAAPGLPSWNRMNGMPSGEKSLGNSPSLKFATPAEPCVSPSRQASPNGSLLNTTSLQSTSLDVGSERLVYLGLYPDLGFGDGVSVCPPPLQRFRPNNVRCPAFENARRSNPTNQRPHTFSPGQLPPKPKDTPRGVRFDFADTHRSPSLSVNRHVPSDVKGGGRYIHPHPPPRKQHRETTYMDPRSEMSCESQLHTPLKRYTKNARLPKVQAPFSSRCSLPSSNIDRQHLCSEPRSRSLFNATQSIDESNWSRPFTQDSHPSNRRTRLGSAISTPCSTRAMGSSTNTVRRLGEIASKMANAHLSCPQIHRTPLVRSEARASHTHPKEPTTLHAVYRDTSR